MGNQKRLLRDIFRVSLTACQTVRVSIDRFMELGYQRVDIWTSPRHIRWFTVVLHKKLTCPTQGDTRMTHVLLNYSQLFIVFDKGLETINTDIRNDFL